MVQLYGWVRGGQKFIAIHCSFNFCSPAVSMTFDGSSSVVTTLLDRTKFGFGENGGITFRTRDAISTLLLLQFRALSGGADQFLEFRLYEGRVQLYSSFSQSKFV